MDKKQEEVWAFGTATAAVTRADEWIIVRVRGAITAMVLEALHMRFGQQPCDLRRVLIIEPGALLLCTGMSAIEAARRGTPATAAGRCHVTIGVAPSRLRWAREHSLVMSLFGLSRAAFALRLGPAPSTQLELPLQRPVETLTLPA